MYRNPISWLTSISLGKGLIDYKMFETDRDIDQLRVLGELQEVAATDDLHSAANEVNQRALFHPKLAQTLVIKLGQIFTPLILTQIPPNATIDETMEAVKHTKFDPNETISTLTTILTNCGGTTEQISHYVTLQRILIQSIPEYDLDGDHWQHKNILELEPLVGSADKTNILKGAMIIYGADCLLRKLLAEPVSFQSITAMHEANGAALELFIQNQISQDDLDDIQKLSKLVPRSREQEKPPLSKEQLPLFLRGLFNQTTMKEERNKAVEELKMTTMREFPELDLLFDQYANKIEIGKSRTFELAFRGKLAAEAAIGAFRQCTVDNNFADLDGRFLDLLFQGLIETNPTTTIFNQPFNLTEYKAQPLNAAIAYLYHE